MTIAGVDLASWQGEPGQWQPEAASAGYQWAAVKLTELQPGGVQYVDPDAAADWTALAAAGKIRIAYLFGHPSTDAHATVALFAQVLGQLGLEAGDAIALDLEQTDGQPPADVDSWAVNVCQLLAEQFGRRPLVYTFRNFISDGNCASLGAYPLWISDPSSPEGQPAVLAPWTSWMIHQFSTAGNLDRDVANYESLEAMAEGLGGSGATAPPAPAPAPAPSWTETTVQQLPTLGQGALGPHVRVIQGLCNASGYVLAVDGDFGPLTAGAVKAIQTRAGIGVDGIVGPQTYPVLLQVA